MDPQQQVAALEELFGTISILQAGKLSQVAAAVLAIYDHALTLDEEIRLVWDKPFSLVSLLYYVNRYVGDVVIILDAILYANTFFSVDLCRDFVQISIWGPFITVWATQLIMQLRLYAIFGKSKKLLALIMPLLVAEICGISAVLILYIRKMEYSNTLLPPDEAIPGLNLHMCTPSSNERLLTAVYAPLFGYEAVMFMLALGALLWRYDAGRKQVVQTGSSRVNATVNLLMQSSIAYFFVYFVLCAVAVGMYLGLPFTYAEVLNSFLTVASIVLGSRLVLSFRAYNYRSQAVGTTSNSHFGSDVLPSSAYAYGQSGHSVGMSRGQRTLSSAAFAPKGSGQYGLASFSHPIAKGSIPYWNSRDTVDRVDGSYLELEDVAPSRQRSFEVGRAV